MARLFLKEGCPDSQAIGNGAVWRLAGPEDEEDRH